MTRAQADELIALGRAEIAKWVAKLTPVAGQNAVVEGSSVSLMKPPAPPPVTPPVQTWVWRLFATLEGELSGEGDTVEIDIQNAAAAHVVRSTRGLVLTSFWSANTQLLDTPQEDSAPLQRSYELTLTARAIKPTEAVDVESGFTPPDFILTLEEYDSSTDDTAGEVVDTITMTLNNGTASRNFTQRRPGRITSLRLVGLKRI